MSEYIQPPKALPPGSYVWAYLRDSGGPSQEQSVGQQENVIRAYSQTHGLVLVEIFKDIARSGGSVIEREEFNRMVDQSKDDPPAGLLVWNFARFARDNNDSVYFKALLRKRGIVIHSLTDQIPDDDFAGRIVETIIDLANEEKRRQTSRDVKRGLRSLVSKGFAPGTPPKGYKRVPVTIGNKRDGQERTVSKWEPDPALWDAVILAWRMRAEGKSYLEIQKATGGKIYNSKNCWYSFFRNRSYIGYYGDVPDHHEPAITFEIWDAVQKLREGHPLYKRTGHLHHPRRVGNPTLFSGIAYCLVCGSAMTHSPGHKSRPWRFYMCSRKDRRNKTACTSKRVSAKQAEEAILSTVLYRILSPSFLEEIIEETRIQFGNTNDIERQIKLSNHKLDDLDIAIQRTLNAIERTGSQSALDRLKQRETERAQVRLEIEKLKAQHAAAKVEITPEAMAIVLNAWRDQILRVKESGDVRQLKAWLMRFVSKIELGYNSAKIHYTYPMSDFSHQAGSKTRNALYPLGGTESHQQGGSYFLENQ